MEFHSVGPQIHGCQLLFLCLIGFASLFTVLVSAVEDETTESVFYVKPGAGSLDVKAKVKEFECKFTYTAQGGTHEEWNILMEYYEAGRAVACSVERSSASYLFFQEFKMELTGPLVAITEIETENSKKDRTRLGEEEYKLTKNSISSVEGKFKNHLERVAVYSPLPRRDL